MRQQTYEHRSGIGRHTLNLNWGGKLVGNSGEMIILFGGDYWSK